MGWRVMFKYLVLPQSIVGQGEFRFWRRCASRYSLVRCSRQLWISASAAANEPGPSSESTCACTVALYPATKLVRSRLVMSLSYSATTPNRFSSVSVRYWPTPSAGGHRRIAEVGQRKCLAGQPMLPPRVLYSQGSVLICPPPAHGRLSVAGDFSPAGGGCQSRNTLSPW